MATVDTFPIYKGDRVCRINVGDRAVLADMLARGWSIDQPAVAAESPTDPAPRKRRASKTTEPDPITDSGFHLDGL
jgi:hypothetical protein